MRGRLIILLLILAACGVGSSPAAAQGPPPPAVPLSSGWAHAPDPGDSGLRRGWSRGGPAAGWKPVGVPHLFDRVPVEERFSGRVGWYRARFRAPAAQDGVRWGFRFEQVRRQARVWLNGREVGRHSDPYVPFEVPATGLRPGRTNTLVVRVDSRKGPEPREGWWNWGGISRPVTLVPRGQAMLDDVGVLSDVDCPDGGADRCAASIIVDGTVSHRRSGTLAPTVAVTLTAPDGTVSRGASKVRALRKGERARIRFSVPVRGTPQLWSPDSPTLYRAQVTTRIGDRVVQVDEKRVGLRQVSVRNGMLTLNGRAVDLRGASIQEDLAGRGPALSEADMDLIVEELQEVGANVTRAHYLLNDRLLDRFDEAGILVWNQAPVYHRDDLLVTAEQRARELRTLRGTVIAARSHPSVITHSVANELAPDADDVPGTAAFLRSARGVVHDLDPTVPVSVDLLSYPGYDRQEAFARYDLLGINSYYGWYKGKKTRSTANLGDLEPFLADMRAKYPASALVLTEFGAESTYAGPRTEKETFAFQSDYVSEVLQIVDRSPFLGGAIYWTLHEFAVKPDWDGGANRDVPRDGIHNKGLISYTGDRKEAWAVAREHFRDTPLYRDQALAAGGVANGGGGIRTGLLVAFVTAFVLGLIVLDAWVLGGILGDRRRRARAAVETE